MTTGVVLMTYGSPQDLDDVGAYITRVRGGRAPDDALLAEFRRRYERIGMSPLISITRDQANALEVALGSDFRVTAGMRFSEPSIESAVHELNGVDRVVGLILSPQYSPTLMGGYHQALSQAAGELSCRTVGAWHLNPAFVDVLASHIRHALAAFPHGVRDEVPVLLTAHSLPKRVVDREPDYVAQLKDTAHAVAQAADLLPERWFFVYQSAGHTPEEWLKPDMLDVLPELAAAGHRAVIVAPVQFLADHLETLYDVDVAGREQAEQAGITSFTRVAAPNAAPDFIDALASVVRGELAAWEGVARGVRWATA
ncbi:MAG TPA: ferrochelatase [Chloroflexota bacterium]|nr:ferrochelatase [Chloroflexota bacterium]